MRNASGHKCKEKMKKVNEKAYDISSIKKFLEVSHCSCAKRRQKNVQKKLFFLLIRPTVVFHHSLALPSRLSITRELRF